MNVSRYWSRLTNPRRAVRGLWTRMEATAALRYENQPRYLFNRARAAQERERALTAGNVPVCRELELNLDGLDAQLPPEVLESPRRQRGIAGRILDVAVPEVGLQ
jgi:hypothetical protein